MRLRDKTLAVVLAGAVPLSACTTTHLYGDYHPRSSVTSRTERVSDSVKGDVPGFGKQQPILAEGHSFQFLWGTLNTGDTVVDDLLSPSLKDKTLTNISVEDHISLVGAALWIVTAGIFSHHSIVVRGDFAPESTPPVAAPAAETP
jgi:hypothetical protein